MDDGTTLREFGKGFNYFERRIRQILYDFERKRVYENIIKNFGHGIVSAYAYIKYRY